MASSRRPISRRGSPAHPHEFPSSNSTGGEHPPNTKGLQVNAGQGDMTPNAQRSHDLSKPPGRQSLEARRNGRLKAARDTITWLTEHPSWLASTPLNQLYSIGKCVGHLVAVPTKLACTYFEALYAPLLLQEQQLPRAAGKWLKSVVTESNRAIAKAFRAPRLRGQPRRFEPEEEQRYKNAALELVAFFRDLASRELPPEEQRAIINREILKYFPNPLTDVSAIVDDVLTTRAPVARVRSVLTLTLAISDSKAQKLIYPLRAARA